MNKIVNKIKRGYTYIFYKFYSSLEKYSAPPFWSEWKASSMLSILLTILIYSLLILYMIFIDRHSEIGGNPYIMVSTVVGLNIMNYIIFLRCDQWKIIVKRFDKLSPKKNKIGSWIVLGLVILVILSLILAFYLMSQVDWSLYK